MQSRGATILLTCVLLLTLATARLSASENVGRSDKRPNLIFFLADDMGWVDSTLYGSVYYETPNVDQLATRGMRFTNAYAANPLCSPTRASILTGQYPGRVRITTPACHLQREVLDPIVPERAAPAHRAVIPQTRTRLPLDYYTLAETLHDAGYTTAHLGKWHLGWPPYHPENQGFDFNFPGGSYPGPPGTYFRPFKADILMDSPLGTHIEDRMAEEAVRFLRENRQGPFFLNYWMFSVHAPFEAKQELIEKYRAKLDPNNTQRCPTMGGMLQTMDECVGRVVAALDELQLTNDTIMIFTSDNGGNMYNEVEGETPTNNHPLRGGKATIYEGGIRVPLIVIWPGHIRPGSESDQIVTSVDYYPTLLEMLDLEARPDQTLDGVSILPVLLGEGELEREAVFFHFPHPGVPPARFPSTAVRRGPWKLIRAYCDSPDQSDRFELYNLDEDLGETNNLADAMPDKVRQLNALISRHLEDTDALVPIPNPNYNPPVGGWTANGQAELAWQEGRFVITSTGGDPIITTSQVPPITTAATLELRIKSTSRGRAQFFWTTKKDRNFFRDRSTLVDVVHDGQWNDYRVPLPIGGSTLTALRIDPSQGPGRIEIEGLRLLDSEGNLVAEWPSEE